MSTPTRNREAGFSLPSVIIGSLILAIISYAATSSMWGSVDKSKISTVASVIKAQVNLFDSQPNFDYESLNVDKDHNYLPELIAAGILPPIPGVFNDQDGLVWEIRMTLHDGIKRVYYSYISPSNQDDQAIIDAAIANLKFNESRVWVD
ncbi:MAG: hypothetical protein JXK16_02920 [Thiotrichales bacterium]|nr:hypothetical protein [Thiotrichales bacterium]